MNKIDINNRSLPEIERIKSSEKIKKIALAVTPLLMLYQPFNIAAQIGVGCQNIFTTYKEGERVKHLIAISTLVLMIISPTAVALVSHAKEMGIHGKRALLLYSEKRLKETGIELLKASHEAVYLVSIAVGGPIPLAVSLAAQGVFEIIRAYQLSKQKNMQLESLVQVVLSLLRGYKLYSLNEQYNHFLTRLNSPILVIRGSHTLLKDHAVIYEECDFSNTKFSDLKLNEVTFRNCNLKNSFFAKGEINQGRFENCDLQQATFYETALKTTEFMQCQLEKADFFSSFLQNVKFDGCQLQETSFFQAEVLTSEILNSDLTNTLFTTAKDAFKIAGGTPHRMTKPVIARAKDYEIEGSLELKLMEAINSAPNDHAVLHYTVNLKKVAEELPVVEEMLSALNEAPEESDLGKIRSFGALVASHVNGVHITGENVSTKRNFIDLALLEAAKSRSLDISGSGKRISIVENYFNNRSVDKETLRTIFALLAADTSEDDVSLSSQATLDLMHRQIRRIAACTGSSIDVAFFEGLHANSENILNYIKELKVTPNDILIAHFLFHGMRLPSKTSRWPTMYFPNNFPDYFNRDLNSMVDFDLFIEALKNKNPRFLLASTESCNGIQKLDEIVDIRDPDDDPEDHESIQEIQNIAKEFRAKVAKLGPSFHYTANQIHDYEDFTKMFDTGEVDDDTLKYRKLFIDTKGSIIASASSPGENAVRDAFGFGGFFGYHFLRVLRVEDPEEVTWEGIYNQTKTYVQEHAAKVIEDYKQTPQVEINITTA